MAGIIDDILPESADLLAIRDDVGAALKVVKIVTRTWTGTELGDGQASESSVQMLPSPRVVEYVDEYKIREGGAVRQGDVMLKMVSKAVFPNRTDVDGSSEVANVEKLYEVGGKLYRVVAVTEKHLTWNVLLRPLSNQGRY